MDGDKHTIRAKRQGLRARSAYKLEEINKRFKLMKPKDKVFDIGCWPGGWMVVAKKIVVDGYVLGIDKKEIEPIEGCDFILGDIMDADILDKIEQKKFDVVLSDLSPKTTGIKEVDVEKSQDLCLRALFIANNVLKKNGNFLCKIFQGRGEEFLERLNKKFRKINIYKPLISKKRSKEIYIIAKGFKNGN